MRVLHLSGSPIAPRAAWLIPLIALFAVVTFVRAEPLTVFLGVVLTLFLMATLAVSYADGRWLEFGLADYAVRFLRLAWSMISRPFSFRGPTPGERGTEKPSSPSLWPVVRGLSPGTAGLADLCRAAQLC